MDKIVGRIGLLSALFFIASSYAHISLELTDMQGNELQEASAGEPFLMVVSVEDSDQQDEPTVKGLQDFYVKRISQRLMSVNGKKSASYSYQVRVDKAGTYTIGPAYYDDSQEKSKAVRIKVQPTGAPRQQVKQNQKEKKDAKTEPVLFRLYVDRDTAYVGQKVKALLRFYFPEDETITVEQVTVEDPTTIDMTKKEGPKKGTQEIENKRYTFYEWEWDMFPRQAGQIVIPAYSLDFAKHLPMDKHLSGWASLLGPRYERKRIYSNAITLQVHELPPTDKQIDAVGHFTQYRATLNTAVAKQYEGIVLSLSLDGIAYMDALQLPELIMPDGLKWYASKQYVDDLSVGKRKTFEFIVQGLKEGDFEIPEQPFIFFDVETSSYKQLQTAPLFVTILPGHVAAPIPQQNQQKQPVIVEKTHIKTDAIEPISYEIEGSQAAKAIPWTVFFMLLCIPIFYILGMLMIAKIPFFIHRIFPQYVRRKRFLSVKKQLEFAALHHKTDEIYAIIKQLFAMNSAKNSATLSLDELISVVEKSSLSSDQKHQCKEFLSNVSEIAYGVPSESQHSKTLFNDAMIWINQLERIL